MKPKNILNNTIDSIKNGIDAVGERKRYLKIREMTKRFILKSLGKF